MQRYTGILRHLLLPILLCSAAILLAWHPLEDDDIYYHLAIGREISQGNIPTADIFSHTSPGRSFVLHAPLFGLLIHGFYYFFGELGFLIYNFVASVLLALTLWYFCRQLNSSRFTSFALALGTMGLISQRLNFRAEIIVYCFVLILLSIILRWLKTKREVSLKGYAIFALFLIFWNNFIINPPQLLLLGAFTIVEFLLEKRRLKTIIFFASTVLIYGIHTNGFDIISMTFAASDFERYRPVEENRAFDLQKDFVFLAIMAGCLWFLLLAWKGAIKHRRVKRTDIFFSITFISLAFVSIFQFRVVSFFLIINLPLINRALSFYSSQLHVGRKFSTVLFAVAGLGFAVFVAFEPMEYYIDGRIAPAEAADFLEKNPPPGKMYNPFDSSAYLLWRLGKSQPVFWDIRTDLHAVTARQTFENLHRGFLRPYLRSRGVTFIIHEYWPELRYANHSMKESFLFPSREYALVYANIFHAIYIDRKCEICAGYIRKHELNESPFEKYWGKKRGIIPPDKD